MHRIKTRSINQLKSTVSKQSLIPMILCHANRNRKTGTQLPSVNFNSQDNSPLLKFGARTAERTEWHLARSPNLHGKAHQHAEVTTSQSSEPKGMCPSFSAARMQILNKVQVDLHQHVGLLTEVAEVLKHCQLECAKYCQRPCGNASFWESYEAEVLYCHAKICQN